MRGRRARRWLSACVHESWLFPATSLFPSSKRWLVHGGACLRIRLRGRINSPAPADHALSFQRCHRQAGARLRTSIARARQRRYPDRSSPARSSAWAIARAVAPVVKMSSIDQDVLLPRSLYRSVTLNAPRTLTRRCRGVRPAWLSVARCRTSTSRGQLSRHCGIDWRKSAKAHSASSRAWLNPRCRGFRPMQRNGHNQHLGRRVRTELGDGCSQHAAQAAAAAE